ncbi:spore coat protein CotJB, partial [Caproiciproducens sp.]
MTEQEALMTRIRSYQFAMWELHIFLDTHPGDCKAAQKLEEYRKATNEMTAKYEAAYGPVNVSAQNTSRWAWVADPWPWDGTAAGNSMNVQGMSKQKENTMPWANNAMPWQSMNSAGNTAVQGANTQQNSAMPWMNMPMAQNAPNANTAVQGANTQQNSAMPWMNMPMA